MLFRLSEYIHFKLLCKVSALFPNYGIWLLIFFVKSHVLLLFSAASQQIDAQYQKKATSDERF